MPGHFYHIFASQLVFNKQHIVVIDIFYGQHNFINDAHIWGQERIKKGVNAISGCWVSCWFSPYSERFFSGNSGFPAPQKSTFPNSNSTRNEVDEESLIVVDVLPLNRNLLNIYLIFKCRFVPGLMIYLLIVNSDDTWDTFWLCDMHNISLVWES